MNKTLLYFILLLFIWLHPTVSEGQERMLKVYQLKENTFYGLHAGFNYTWNSNSDDGAAFLHLRPSIAFSLGKWFSPVVGIRGMAALSNNRGGIKETNEGYGWQSFDVGIDGLLSLTNLFREYEEERRLNVFAFAGVGGIQTFGFTKPDWNANQQYFNPDGSTLLQYRVGAMVHLRVSDHWDFSLELSHNLIHDSFDGHVTNHRWDRRTTFYFGFIRRLRNRDNSHQFRYATLDVSKFDAPMEQINELRRQETAAIRRPNPIRDVDSHQTIVLVSFPAGSSTVNKMQEVNVYTIVQAWNQMDKACKVYITSLGSPDSEQLFNERAEVISKALSERYGLPTEDIITKLDSQEVESTDKASDKIIVYINESK